MGCWILFPWHERHRVLRGRMGFPQSRHFPVFRVQAGQGKHTLHWSQISMGTSTTYIYKWFDYSFFLIENISWSKSHRQKWLPQISPITDADARRLWDLNESDPPMGHQAQVVSV
jgi:hypothetical protein